MQPPLLSSSGTIKQFANFFVCRLGKILIPLADGKEVHRRVQTYDFVGVFLQVRTGCACSYRHGDENLFGPFLAEGCDSGAHRGTCCQAIIDEYGRASAHVHGTTVPSVFAFTPFEFARFFLSYGIDLLLRDSERLDNLAVEDTDSAGGDCTHGQFFMPWRA
jgi:hypothetical protein